MSRFFDAEQVRALLDPLACARAVEGAMIALSTDASDQPLRQIVPIAPAKLFALMPGLLPDLMSAGGLIGAKVVTAFPALDRPERSQHRGLVIGFDRDTGVLTGVADAGEVTLIRTAAASAVATRALARPGFATCAILGIGEQARAHIRMFAAMFPLERFVVWGRNPAAVEAFIADVAPTVMIPLVAAQSVAAAAAQAEVICTLTSASEPILNRGDVEPGTHINAVGSSFAGPRELAVDLVADSRYIVDCRAYALVAAAEFIEAKRLGLIADEHIVTEIGHVLNGNCVGRQRQNDITIYKSLGHIVQDLAALGCLLDACAK